MQKLVEIVGVFFKKLLGFSSMLVCFSIFIKLFPTVVYVERLGCPGVKFLRLTLPHSFTFLCYCQFLCFIYISPSMYFKVNFRQYLSSHIFQTRVNFKFWLFPETVLCPHRTCDTVKKLASGIKGVFPQSVECFWYSPHSPLESESSQLILNAL